MRVVAIAAAIVPVVCLVAGDELAGQTSGGPGNTRAVAEALAANDRLQAAAHANDAEVLAELLSEDLVVSDPGNKIRHRDDILALFASREVQYRSVERVVDYAGQLGDLVVIMGTETTVVESVPEGSRWGPGDTLHRRFTNIWRAEKGVWRLVIKQSTVFSVE